MFQKVEKKWFDSLHFKGLDCFKNNWVGFDSIKKISVLIGKNNSGKSAILNHIQWLNEISARFSKNRAPNSSASVKDDLRQFLHTATRSTWQYKLGITVTKDDCDTSKFILETPIQRWMELPSGQQFTNPSQKTDVKISAPQEKMYGGVTPLSAHNAFEAMYNNLNQRMNDRDVPFVGKVFRRIYAERNIVSEHDAGEDQYKDFKLAGNGDGASVIFRRLSNVGIEPWNESGIIDKIKDALNEIIGPESQFSELTTKQSEKGEWEIYLREPHKGLIPLSLSGSGLKTIILVLLNMVAIPYLERKKNSDYIFAFEELENNLHPSVLRRLFRYIDRTARDDGPYIILTTHSSVALDYFSNNGEAQIIRVAHDGVGVKTDTITSSIACLPVLTDLGIKPSDLLQANGIIWVEGPSDRLYINRWIELFSNGIFFEGRDYQCVMYGGSLLSNYQIGVSSDDLINFLKINPNLMVICDSDLSKTRTHYKPAVDRIIKEAKALDAFVWVTQPKEIENYLPGEVLAKAFKRSQTLPDPGKTERFFPTKSKGNNSYYETHLSGKNEINKVNLANSCLPFFSLENMRSRFDWEEKMTRLVKALEMWNT